MPANNVDGSSQSVGAVTVVVASVVVGPSRGGFVRGWVVGRDTVSGDVAMFEVAAAGRTNGAGVVTAVGASGITATRADASLAAATALFGVNGGAVELRATGVAGRTIQWTGELTLFVSG